MVAQYPTTVLYCGVVCSVVEDAEGRYCVIVNPAELCDDGEWRVSVENSAGSAQSDCTLTLRGNSPAEVVWL